jgi:hypothetical protein
MNEHGNLYQKDTIVWSYTGYLSGLTLGWRPRKYGRRGRCIAVKWSHEDKQWVSWVSCRVLKTTKKFTRTIGALNKKDGVWHERWQITP